MRKSEALLSLALLGSAAASVWFWSELRTERTRNAELDARLAQIAAGPGTQSESESSPQAPPDGAAPNSANDDSPEVTAPGRRRIAVTQEDDVARQRRLMRDPKYREAWREQRRLMFAPRRENAIRLLGLSPAEADAVVELSIERQLAWFDREPIDEMDSETFQRLEAADERAEQAKLRELLGEEKRARWQIYMESRPSRVQVDRFRTFLAGADTLRDDQVEPLIAALHVEQSQMRQELEDYRQSLKQDGDTTDESQKYQEREAELMKAAHARMHTGAAAILSRSQLEKLDAMLKRDRERQAARDRMEGLQAKLDKAAGVEADPD